MNTSFKLLFTLLVVLVSLSVTAQVDSLTKSKNDKNPKQMDQVKMLVSKITKDDVYKTLIEFIKATRPSRFVGTSGHKNSHAFLLDYIGKIKGSRDLLWVDEFVPDIEYAIKMYNRDFENQIIGKYPPQSTEYRKADRLTKSAIATLKNFKGQIGKNIIYEKKGIKNPNHIIILGAHLDTVVVNPNTSSIDNEVSMPGADNNASGTSVLLGLIKIISQLNTDKTIRIVFFDFENLGFLGSRNFVEKYYDELINSKNQLAGFINVLMLGHDTVDEDQQKQTGNMKIYTRKQNAKDMGLANVMNLGGIKVIGGINFTIDPNNFQDGSNISFWEKELPAIAMTGNWEDDPNFKMHTPNDLIETLNITTLQRAFQHITLAVICWAFDIKK